MIEIQAYQDYRKFLRDFHVFKLNQNKHWSIGLWCQQLGLSSSSTMNMILNEKRHAGKKVIDALSSYFKFNDKEDTYFRTLVSVQKRLKDPQLMMVFWESYQNQNQIYQESNLDLRVTPLTYVLREMVKLKGYQQNSQWIKNKLAYFFSDLSEGYLDAYMKQLVDKGYLTFSEKRKAFLPSQPLTSEYEERPTEANIKKFHDKLIETTKEALSSSPKDKRTFQTSYLTIKSENFEKAMSLMTEFQDKFSELIEETEGEGDSLCQLNLQFFELASTRKDLPS